MVTFYSKTGVIFWFRTILIEIFHKRVFIQAFQVVKQELLGNNRVEYILEVYFVDFSKMNSQKHASICIGSDEYLYSIS